MKPSEYLEIHNYDHQEDQGLGCILGIAKIALILIIIIFGIGIVAGAAIISIASGLLV